jgi:uncharacterized protein
MNRQLTVLFTPLLFAVLLFAGCSTTPNARFYTLSSDSTPESLAASYDKASYSVAVGPVTVPDYVDQPQLVVRVSANEVRVEEFNRWAEPLESQIPRVIAANLERELVSARVITLNQSGGLDADFRVGVDVQRFDLVLGGAVTVGVDWTVRRFGGGEFKDGQSGVREPTGSDSYEALVAALSRAFERVSRDIAQAVRAAAAMQKGDT